MQDSTVQGSIVCKAVLCARQYCAKQYFVQAVLSWWSTFPFSLHIPPVTPSLLLVNAQVQTESQFCYSSFSNVNLYWTLSDQLGVLFNWMQTWAGLKHISSREILSDLLSMLMQITILNVVSGAWLKSVAQNVMSGFIIADLLPLCCWRLSYLLGLNLWRVVTGDCCLRGGPSYKNRFPSSF